MEWLVVFNLAGYGIIPVSPLWILLWTLGVNYPKVGIFVFKFYTCSVCAASPLLARCCGSPRTWCPWSWMSALGDLIFAKYHSRIHFHTYRSLLEEEKMIHNPDRFAWLVQGLTFQHWWSPKHVLPETGFANEKKIRNCHSMGPKSHVWNYIFKMHSNPVSDMLECLEMRTFQKPARLSQK